MKGAYRGTIPVPCNPLELGYVTTETMRNVLILNTLRYGLNRCRLTRPQTTGGAGCAAGQGAPDMGINARLNFMCRSSGEATDDWV